MRGNISKTIGWSKCPYCGKTLSFSSRRGMGRESMIGETELSPCPYCRKLISNGKKEWPEMTPEEQFQEKSRFILLDILAAFIFGLTGGALIGIATETNIILLGLLGFITAFILFRLLNKSLINESIERYNKKNNINNQS